MNSKTLNASGGAHVPFMENFLKAGKCCPCLDFREPGEGCDCFCHEHPSTILRWAENAVTHELGPVYACFRAVRAIRIVGKRPSLEDACKRCGGHRAIKAECPDSRNGNIRCLAIHFQPCPECTLEMSNASTIWSGPCYPDNFWGKSLADTEQGRADEENKRRNQVIEPGGSPAV